MDIRQLAPEIVHRIVEGDSSASSWGERGFFVVDVLCKGMAGDEIEVAVDCDGTEEKRGVGIDDCVLLSREISAAMETVLGEEADYSLSVMSAGLGQPLKLGRQYEKLMNRSLESGVLPRVDVLFKDGRKLTGVVLCGIGYNNGDAGVPAAIEVMYEVKELLAGKKRKEMVEKREQVTLAETKAVSEHFDFK